MSNLSVEQLDSIPYVSENSRAEKLKIVSSIDIDSCKLTTWASQFHYFTSGVTAIKAEGALYILPSLLGEKFSVICMAPEQMDESLRHPLITLSGDPLTPESDTEMNKYVDGVSVCQPSTLLDAFGLIVALYFQHFLSQTNCKNINLCPKSYPEFTGFFQNSPSSFVMFAEHQTKYCFFDFYKQYSPVWRIVWL